MQTPSNRPWGRPATTFKTASKILCLGLALLLCRAVAGCKPPSNEGPPPDPSELTSLRLPDGPLEEVRVRRDTRGGFVVSGLSYFPEQTQLSLVLYDSTGRAVARTQAEVVNSLFQSLPLHAQEVESWPAGAYEIGIEATFAPGAQPERVLQASRDGTALSGEGMTTTVQGRPAFTKRIPFQVPDGGDR